jgi:DNA repair exonuclease SbcCD ATPase subunit
MATLTESDLKQFLEQINQNLVSFRQEVKQDMTDFRQEVKQDMADFRQEVNQKFEKQDKRLRTIEIDLATFKGEIKGEITGLSKRVDDLNSHFNIMTVGFLSIVGVLVTGILGIIGKVTFFPNP